MLNNIFNFKALVKASLCVATAALMTATGFAGEDNNIERWVKSDHRSEDNSMRDEYRHPVGTLQFFSIKEDMKIAEIWPGVGGWYQEILAPFLKDKGVYYSAGSDLNSKSSYAKRSIAAINGRIKDQPEYYGKMVVTELSPRTNKFDIAPEGSLDMVVSFRNFHNWQKGQYEDKVLSAVANALKVGGIFALTDHRKTDEARRDIYDGYVYERDVIEAAKAAGLKFVAKSEVNANPKDSKDYAGGVWTLPPRLSGGAVDVDKMLDIGESDRLTMKFVKVAQ